MSSLKIQSILTSHSTLLIWVLFLGAWWILFGQISWAQRQNFQTCLNVRSKTVNASIPRPKMSVSWCTGRTYCTPSSRVSSKGTPHTHTLIKFLHHDLAFIFRRGHKVLQESLPPKSEHVLLLRMTKIQRRLYRRFIDELIYRKSISNPLKAFAVWKKALPT